jgi:hypothetical protein
VGGIPIRSLRLVELGPTFGGIVLYTHGLLPFNNKHKANNIIMKLTIVKSTKAQEEEDQEEGSYNYS